MTTKTEFTWVDIDNSAELVAYFPAITELFLTSFGKPLCSKMWHWAYQENPFGHPLVSMAFYEGKLVGHYAVIPIDLHNEDQVLKGYLSMTTMVSVDFRRHQLFRKLADRVYDRIENRGEASVVFGFPNNQSAPGFIKRLGWKVSENYHVVSLRTTDIEQAQELLSKSTKSAYRLDLESVKVGSWRSSKPNQEWQIRNGVGIKQYPAGFDLMYLNSGIDLSKLELSGTVNAILPISKEKALELDWEISFPYRFGYRVFNTEQQPTFLVQMCMSDVF